MIILDQSEHCDLASSRILLSLLLLLCWMAAAAAAAAILPTTSKILAAGKGEKEGNVHCSLW